MGVSKRDMFPETFLILNFVQVMIHQDLIQIIEKGVFEAFVQRNEITKDSPGIDQMELARVKQNTKIVETRIRVQVHNSWQNRDENCLVLK